MLDIKMSRKLLHRPGGRTAEPKERGKLSRADISNIVGGGGDFEKATLEHNLLAFEGCI